MPFMQHLPLWAANELWTSYLEVRADFAGVDRVRVDTAGHRSVGIINSLNGDV